MEDGLSQPMTSTVAEQLRAAAAALAASSVSVQSQKIPIALSIPQDQIPLTSAADFATASGEEIILSGSGYGPRVLTRETPIQSLLRSATSPSSDGKPSDLNSVVVPLTNASWKSRWESMCLATPQADDPQGYVKSSRYGQFGRKEVEAERWRSGGGFVRGEVNITRPEEAKGLTVYASEWLELDSPVEGIRLDSELALKQEVSYASFLHVQTLILPPPRYGEYVADYARAVNSALGSSSYITLSVRIPISDPLDMRQGAAAGKGASDGGTWETWNTIRHLCGYSSRLTPVLDLSTPLPSLSSLSRWVAEPIREILLPATAFISNAKGYPVLSKTCQAFMQMIFKLRPTVILTQTTRSLHNAGGPNAYVQYVRFLERKAPGPTPLEHYAGSYNDYLQVPLQPLQDNLETETYEGFERCLIKYAQYEEAIYRALCDRPSTGTIVIYVAGAGRGPLVAASLKASVRARRQVKITAVEKNPNAFITLQERKATEWGDEVEIVFSDMRSFKHFEQADILVSELLGSFGDNELSPECLDGVMRCLKSGGVCIPYSYTSYLAPISSSKLHADVNGGLGSDLQKQTEQPYVVMFQAANILSGHGGKPARERVQACWQFVHPRTDVLTDGEGLPLTNNHNARTSNLTFHIPQAGVCHGFGGYFEAVLYGDVVITIHPERQDPRQLSWFPFFFPLRDPLYLPAGSELDVHIYRITDSLKRRIYYEWSAEAYLQISAHTMSATPTTGSLTSPTGNGGADAFSPKSSWPSPGIGAYDSAPSPMVATTSGEGFSPAASTQDMNRPLRIRIGMTRLHNPSGRTSFVAM